MSHDYKAPLPAHTVCAIDAMSRRILDAARSEAQRQQTHAAFMRLYRQSLTAISDHEPKEN